MVKRRIVHTYKLEPGMVLAEDLLDLRSGVVLIKKDTILSEKMLQSIYLFSHKDRYEVYLHPSVDIGETTEEKIRADWPGRRKPEYLRSTHFLKGGKKMDVEDHLKPLPERISRRSQKIYKDSLNVIKTFYERPDIITDEQIHDTFGIAERITEEILRDPQILLQLAILKAFDNYTFSHAVHVSIYATTLAKFLEFQPEEIPNICLAALLHDICLLYTSGDDNIFNPPGDLQITFFIDFPPY